MAENPDRAAVMKTVNAGADLVIEAMTKAGQTNGSAADVANVVVCAIGTLLDNPDATIVDVLAENYPDTAGQWREEFGDDVVDQALELKAAQATTDEPGQEAA